MLKCVLGMIVRALRRGYASVQSVYSRTYLSVHASTRKGVLKVLMHEVSTFKTFAALKIHRRQYYAYCRK